jgi:hypothetical protein
MEYYDMLVALQEPLVFIRWACDAEVGTGRGAPADRDAYRFVLLFAGAWTKHGCGNVSAAERAPFWRVLDADSGHLDRRLPHLKRATVREAVVLWRRYHSQAAVGLPIRSD